MSHHAHTINSAGYHRLLGTSRAPRVPKRKPIEVLTMLMKLRAKGLG